MQSDGLWNGHRCAGGQYLRKKRKKGMNDFKKTHNFLVSLKMPHWSDCLKKTSSENPVPFSGTFVAVLSPFGALVLFKDYANSLYFGSYSRASPSKMDRH